jgi:hypothetical protein
VARARHRLTIRCASQKVFVADSELLVVAAANTETTKRSAGRADQGSRGAAMRRGWSVTPTELRKRIRAAHTPIG